MSQSHISPSATVDLYTKKPVADTWYSGDYFDLIDGWLGNMMAILPMGNIYNFRVTSD